MLLMVVLAIWAKRNGVRSVQSTVRSTSSFLWLFQIATTVVGHRIDGPHEARRIFGFAVQDRERWGMGMGMISRDVCSCSVLGPRTSPSLIVAGENEAHSMNMADFASEGRVGRV